MKRTAWKLDEVKQDADVIVEVTKSRLASHSGLAWSIIKASLNVNGWYTCTKNGKKILFILKDGVK